MTPAAPRPIEVSAGLVFRGGRLLITQRPAGGHLAGCWEFPGGKREPAETWEACLRRELAEELAIEVEVGDCVEDLVHEYPGKTVHLRFFRCAWARNEPQAIGCPAFAWVKADELGNYEFPAADAHLLGRLRETPAWWRSPRRVFTRRASTAPSSGAPRRPSGSTAATDA